MKITIDFETRSKADIWAVGAWAYSVHPSTEILCMAYAIDNNSVQLVKGIPTDAPLPRFPSDAIFVAYNAFFEQCIWQNIMVKKYGWPRIPIIQWRDVMAKVCARSLPRSLENCGKALNAPVQKSAEGHRIMLKLSKPNSKGLWNEDLADLEALYKYCVQDVEAERCIDNMLPDLIPQEQTICFLDQLINQRGIHVDTQAVAKALEFAGIYTKDVNALVARVSKGRLDGVSRRMAVLEWVQDQGVAIKGYTKADVNAVLQQKTLPPAVRTVLEAKLSLGKTSVAKYLPLRDSTDTGGVLRDLFVYHGANTGRWAGKLVQLQNLPVDKSGDPLSAVQLLKTAGYADFTIFYPDVMRTLSSCIRGMIVAAPGNKLLVVDYSAIEARVVMWLADEQYGLKQFRNGEDLYVAIAKIIYNKQSISKSERDLGKRAILGCGYNMGAEKFAATCATWGSPVTPELAEKAVNSYRELYQKVKYSWYHQEAAAISAVQDKRVVACGKVSWFVDALGDLQCKLPSGRCLTYNKPGLRYTNTPWGEKKLALHHWQVDAKTNQWVCRSTYGGKLVENMTQATARDILAFAMYRAEKAGYAVAMHVHDEIVAEVPKAFGSLAEFEKLLCVLPKWASGCPITAKGFETQRYRKD